MKGNKGFTILEMIIVIVIMAILATFAVPGIISWRANASLSGDTRTLKSDFELARSRAIQSNTSIDISFDTVNNRYTVDGIPADFIPAVSRSLTGTTITGTGFTGDTVTFDSRGRASETGAVNLTNGSRNTAVSVTSIIGSIRVN